MIIMLLEYEMILDWIVEERGGKNNLPPLF